MKNELGGRGFICHIKSDSLPEMEWVSKFSILLANIAVDAKSSLQHFLIHTLVLIVVVLVIAIIIL